MNCSHTTTNNYTCVCPPYCVSFLVLRLFTKFTCKYRQTTTTTIVCLYTRMEWCQNNCETLRWRTHKHTNTVRESVGFCCRSGLVGRHAIVLMFSYAILAMHSHTVRLSSDDNKYGGRRRWGIWNELEAGALSVFGLCPGIKLFELENCYFACFFGKMCITVNTLVVNV